MVLIDISEMYYNVLDLNARHSDSEITILFYSVFRHCLMLDYVPSGIFNRFCGFEAIKESRTKPAQNLSLPKSFTNILYSYLPQNRLP